MYPTRGLCAIVCLANRAEVLNLRPQEHTVNLSNLPSLTLHVNGSESITVPELDERNRTWWDDPECPLSRGTTAQTPTFSRPASKRSISQRAGAAPKAVRYTYRSRRRNQGSRIGCTPPLDLNAGLAEAPPQERCRGDVHAGGLGGLARALRAGISLPDSNRFGWGSSDLLWLR
jgi:hypothetical protein